jgi:response regulator RpfG family c-di-GMP phosphodiesterase
LVDDALDQLDMYAMVLEERYDVIKASRGEAGFLAAVAEQPDVIILDLLLPDIDGVALFRRLRATPETSRIPTIFITGHEDSLFDALASPHAATVFAILKKPAPAEQLFSTISAALKSARAES